MIKVFSVALLALAIASGAVAAGRTKPAARDYDRVQNAGRTALMKLGLVDMRSCDRTDLRCIDSATSSEAAAFRRAVSVEREVARTLMAGNCRTAMFNRAGAYAKHERDVVSARAAWHARDYQAAAHRYYADFSKGGQYDGLFVRYC